MEDKVMERLGTELVKFREYLASGELSVSQLIDRAYEVAMKQFLMDALEGLSADGRMPDAAWDLLGRQDSILGYLYALWLECDYSLIPGLEEALLAELEHGMEV